MLLKVRSSSWPSSSSQRSVEQAQQHNDPHHDVQQDKRQAYICWSGYSNSNNSKSNIILWRFRTLNIKRDSHAPLMVCWYQFTCNVLREHTTYHHLQHNHQHNQQQQHTKENKLCCSINATRYQHHSPECCQQLVSIPEFQNSKFEIRNSLFEIGN